ncbi:DMT family transporter [Oceanibacterium hippocampi]|uniref:Aromatic amino acid exporter n=1 Tax=Oceanibacterium hippocampi TaxID=745714 RepID=A0A1Y5SW28_9PROT|nr:DMT family transporter [Oceanibacterium hippocampi]SLN49990.1 aromatic amino acid exporter [Oceanibacterium hippocampi]
MTGRPVAAALAAAGTGFQVGAAIVATRFAIAEIGPASLAFLRYGIGFLFLVPALLAFRRVPFARRDILPIAVLGIGQFGILIVLLNIALQSISAARAALIFATFPLLTMLIAAMLGRERLGPLSQFGVLLTVAGVAAALGGKAVGDGPAALPWLGYGAAFASTLTGAVCAVFYRPYLERYPALQVSAFAMAASVAFLAVFAAGEGLFAGLPDYSGQALGAVLFIGVSSGIGYWLWLYALTHASPSRVTVFLGLSPITAALLGVPVLGEPLGWATLAGLGILLAGLWLALRGPRAA